MAGRFCRVALAMSAVLLAGALSAGAARAHDVHTFGKVTVALGWLHEPAYVGVDNAVQVIAKDSTGKPITGITDKDLTVAITAAGQTLAVQPLIPSGDPDTGLGMAGEYEYHLIPTVPGAYTFKVTGTVAGQAIDETATSSDKTFNLVTDPTTVQFPTQVPSTTDINTKVDKAQQSADSAKNTALSAMIVGGGALFFALCIYILMGRKDGKGNNPEVKAAKKK